MKIRLSKSAVAIAPAAFFCSDTDSRGFLQLRNRTVKYSLHRCKYSLRDSNIWRKANGIPPVRIGGEEAGLGSRYYENADTDSKEESEEFVASFFASSERHFDNKQVYVGRTKQADGREKDEDGNTINNW